MWQRLANCHKSEQHTVLVQEFHKVCQSQGLSTELYTPIVTAALRQMVIGFLFVGHGANDFGSGCQPFLVAYAGSVHHYQSLAAADVGNQLSQGHHSASLTDYQSIRANEKVKFPRSESETVITLGRFAVLCQVLFQGSGPPHPLVKAMWAVARGFQNVGPFATEQHVQMQRHTPGAASTYFARVVRAVQINVHEYFQQVAINPEENVVGVTVPDFTAMLHELKFGSFYLSSHWFPLPVEYLETTSSATTISTAGSTVRNTPSSSGSAATTRSAHTGVSSITQDTPAPSFPRVPNPAPDAELAAITIRSGSTRNFMRNTRPHMSDTGDSELCVSWWTRNGCYANCGRASTHRPFASATERGRLLAYVREHFAAPPAANA